MSNSSLVTYTEWSPFYTSPRSDSIRGLSIHTMAGPSSVEGCGQVFQTSESSSHYGIGPDGRIGQYVDEGDRAWCCSHEVDHSVVTIEVSSIQSYEEPYECTKAAYESLLSLCTDICRRNKIAELRWKEGEKFCPAYTDNWTACNMVPHRYTTDKDKSCPGSYLFGKYGEIAAEVNRRLAAASPSTGAEKPAAEEEEPMDPQKFIESLTDQQAFLILQKATRHQEALPEPEWSQKEGYWSKATQAGLVDGTSPDAPMKRCEVVAVLGRKGLV